MYEIEMFTILTFNWKVPCRLNWLENRWEWIQTWPYSSPWILDMLGDPIYQITWRSCSEVWPWPSPTDSSLLKSCCTLKDSEWLKNWPRKLFLSSSKDSQNCTCACIYLSWISREKINSWSSLKAKFYFQWTRNTCTCYSVNLIVRNLQRIIFSHEILIKHY